MGEEIDFDRWYWELHNKFTTIRDAYEMNGVGERRFIDDAHLTLQIAKKEKTKVYYNALSDSLNDLMQKWVQK